MVLAVGLTALGLVLLAVTVTDLVLTAVAVGSGAGPVTGRLAGWLWAVALRLLRGTRGHGWLRWAGPLLLFVVIGAWLVGLILGWALVFGQEGAISQPLGQEPEQPLNRIYFAAATILGRGAATYLPSNDVWQVAEQVAATSGLLLVSLSIAYILPVVSAVVHKRETATYVSTLGGSPREILTQAWNGESFGHLDLHLITLAPSINRLAQQHLAYPILHYFHSGQRHDALAPSIVVLDETLTLLRQGMDPAMVPDATALRPCQQAIDIFLQSLDRIRVLAADEPLPAPRLTDYGGLDLPLKEDTSVEEIFGDQVQRRRLLRGFLAHDGWEPDEVHASFEDLEPSNDGGTPTGQSTR